MMTRTFSTRSWPTKIAVEWGQLDPYADTNICHYTRRVIVGVLSLMAAMTMFTALAICVLWGGGVTLAAWVFFALYGKEALGIIVEDPMPVVVTGVLIVIVVGVMGKWIAQRYRNYSRAVMRNVNDDISRPDNAIVQMYKAFKEKTCFKVKLTDRDVGNEND